MISASTSTLPQKSRKTVVVTGVTKGLGRALATELARQGHRVAGCGRTEEKLAELREEIGGDHFFMQADVASDESVQKFAAAILQAVGVPDIVVNNAGVINRNQKLWEVSAEEFDSVIDINVKGTANIIRHVVAPMVEKRRGVIVNFSSGWGRSAAAEVGPYCATKWAVEGLTKSLAKELPPGMVAVALNPGVIDTEMLRSCFGPSASMYTQPNDWAPRCASLILNLSLEDNGASLTV